MYCFPPVLLFSMSVRLFYGLTTERANQRDSKVKMRNKGEAHNHKHLIDSHDLFCCIAVVVPSWPSLWKGGRVKEKKREKKGKHGSRNLSSTPRIKNSDSQHRSRSWIDLLH